MNGNGSFTESLIVQWRVLHALLMRELITRFGRENLGVLWLVGEPMIFTLGVATLWSGAGLSHGGNTIPIIAFAVTGYSSVLMWRNSTSRCSSAIEQNKSLLFHRNVQAMDIFITRIVLEVLGATASFIVLATFFIYIGSMPAPADMTLVMTGWLMLAWFGSSLAILIGGGTSFSPVVERLWHPIAYILFPISGAAFMVDWLPAKLQKVVLLLPMVHGVEILREGFFGGVVPPHYDMVYMAKCNIVLTLVGLLVVREAARRVEF